MINNLLKEVKEWIQYIKFREFYDELSEHVIGQKGLFIIAANIYSYLYNVANNKPINHNMLLTAPSGTGKTETYRAIKRYFDIYIPSLPVYIRDASAITATGYRGSEPAHIVAPLTHSGLHRPIGLVFLDEFDKKIQPSFNSKGVNTNAEAQYCMLTIVEGSDVEIKERGRVSYINTERVMFIGLGSFDYFRDIKKEESKSLGFRASSEVYQHYDSITREDMIEAGGCHELIGRFPTIVNYDILDKTSICRIICQIITSLEDEYNCDIKLSDEFQEDLLKLANGQFGCRLINNVLSERILEQYALALYSYEQDNNKRLVITLDVDNSSYRYRNLTEEEIAEKELQEEYENLLNQK